MRCKFDWYNNSDIKTGWHWHPIDVIGALGKIDSHIYSQVQICDRDKGPLQLVPYFIADHMNPMPQTLHPVGCALNCV